ncbi:hypothetical protein JHD50_01065 [Sulfurimonas sp. MAG313]|nr:hypothetical protein [Sulfurimonas sp. MAG313]MDF1879901.1 hypothetical protein [Sulfurimonas sp. MAG313]
MRSKNFVSFLTVQGFFIGFVFSILKAGSAEDVLVYTLLITGFFYLFSHFIISFFIRHTPVRQEFFPKQRHESDLDYFANEISKREKVIESAHEFLEALEKKYSTKRVN